MTHTVVVNQQNRSWYSGIMVLIESWILITWFKWEPGKKSRLWRSLLRCCGCQL